MKHLSLMRFAFAGVIIVTVIMMPHVVHAGGIFSDIFDGSLRYTAKFLLRAIETVTYLFDVALNITVANNTLVTSSWTIIRDFANMFFILVIVVMAFGTIFDIGGYRLDGGFVTKLIIVALLINFSLVLGQLAIRGVQFVNNVFLVGIGNLGSKLANILDPAVLTGADEKTQGATPSPSPNQNSPNTSPSPTPGSQASPQLKWLTIMSNNGGCFLSVLGAPTGASCYQMGSDFRTGNLVPQDDLEFIGRVRLTFSIILEALLLFSLLIAAFFTFIRIPFLWFLLIFSPLAGLTYILPATRGSWDKWKKEFVAWNVFLPLLLFVLYFGMYFLSRENQLVASLAQQYPTRIFTEPLSSVGLSLQFILFYVLTGFIFIGGTFFALSASRSFGGLAAKGIEWSRLVAAAIPKAAYYGTPASSIVGGIKEGTETRWKRFRQEGVGPYGWLGQMNADRTRAATAEIFGRKGAAEDQMNKQIGYYATRMKDENWDPEKLRSTAENKSGDKRVRLAAYKRLKDLKLASSEDHKEAYGLYRGVGGSSASDFAKDIDFKKDFDKSERKSWFEDTNIDPTDRQRVARVMAEEGELEVKWSEDGSRVEKDNILGALQFLLWSQDSKKDLENARAKIYAGTDYKTAFASLKLKDAEKKSIKDFLLKTSGKKPVEAFRMLEALDIQNTEKGRVYNADDLEDELKKKGGEDFLKLLTGFYNAKTNKITLTNPDQKMLFSAMQQVMEKKKITGNADKFLRNLYRDPKASAEQLGALLLLAKDLGIDLKKRESKSTTPTEPRKGAGFNPAPDGSRSGPAGAVAEIQDANTIDLRNI